MFLTIFRNSKLRFLLIPLIQVVFFFVVYELINHLAHRMQWITSRGVSWGISMDGFVITYVAIIMLVNVLIYFFPKRIVLVSTICAAFFILDVWPVWPSYPYRATVLIAIAVMGIFVHYLFQLAFYFISTESGVHPNGAGGMGVGPGGHE